MSGRVYCPECGASYADPFESLDVAQCGALKLPGTEVGAKMVEEARRGAERALERIESKNAPRRVRKRGGG